MFQVLCLTVKCNFGQIPQVFHRWCTRAPLLRSVSAKHNGVHSHRWLSIPEVKIWFKGRTPQRSSGVAMARWHEHFSTWRRYLRGNQPVWTEMNRDHWCEPQYVLMNHHDIQFYFNISIYNEPQYPNIQMINHYCEPWLFIIVIKIVIQYQPYQSWLIPRKNAVAVKNHRGIDHRWEF